VGEPASQATAGELPPSRAPATSQTCSVRTRVGLQEGLDLALLSESQPGQAKAGRADVPFTRAPFSLEEAESATGKSTGR
jgi:hypothetical protein